MKTAFQKICSILAVLLCMVLCITATGCKDSSGTASDDVIYGDEGDIDYDDDDDIIDDDSDDDETVVVKKGGNSSKVTAASYNDNLKRTFKVDEGAKKNFLESVPKDLSGQEVSIMTWWKPFDFEVKKMEAFTKKTGIKVKWVFADSENYMQKLSAFKAQGNSPDIACITVGNYPAAIMQDYFQPLSAGGLKYDKKVMDIESMDLLKWNGQYYGAIYRGTTHITMGLLMFNQDLFSKYGVTDPHTQWQKGTWTWDTFVKTAQEIQKKSGVTALTGEYQGFRLAQTCGEDAIAFKSGKLVNNTGSKNYRDAYKWMTNLTLDGQYKVADFGLNRNGFMDGKSAMMVEENWALQTGERYGNLSFTLGYAPLPCKTTKTIVPSDAQLWGFPVGAKHTKAAAYVMEYWMNPVFDEAGYSLWVNDSVASFMDWLWEQPKSFKICQGVIEYGGEYKWSTFNYDVSYKNANVDSEMDRWSKTIDSNLKQIYKEFGG